MGDLAGSKPRAGTVQTVLAAAEGLAGMARRREGCRCRQNLTNPRIWNLTASWGSKGAVTSVPRGPTRNTLPEQSDQAMGQRKP